MWVLLNIVFHGEVLLASRPTPKLEDHPSSAVRDCLFNLFAATLHIGGRSSIRNLRTRHAVVTGTHLTRPDYVIPSGKSGSSRILRKSELHKHRQSTILRNTKVVWMVVVGGDGGDDGCCYCCCVLLTKYAYSHVLRTRTSLLIFSLSLSFVTANYTM